MIILVVFGIDYGGLSVIQQAGYNSALSKGVVSFSCGVVGALVAQKLLELFSRWRSLG